MLDSTFENEALRKLVIATDARSMGSVALAELWRDLVAGAFEAVDAFVGLERCYLLLGAPGPGLRALGSQRGLDVLRRVLVAGRQKCVAGDLELAPSTVATLSKQALLDLGLSCRTSDTPFILVVAAAAASDGSAGRARSCDVAYRDRRLLAVSLSRPDLGLSKVLSPAEAHVMSSLFVGQSRSEIAASRNTSQRTVANQLAAAFIALRVTGRLDLLGALAKTAGAAVG